MLRAYVSPTSTDWDQHLVAVEFAYNNTVQASTGFTPFYLTTGQHPLTPLSLLNPCTAEAGNSPRAEEIVGRLQADIGRAREALKQAQRRQKEQADKHRRPAPQFAVGQQVLVSTTNLNLSYTGGQSPKLAPRYLGPFPVKRQINEVAFELTLPANMKCHPVFHVSLLREFRQSEEFPRAELKPPPVKVVDGQAYFRIERIVSHYPRKAQSHEEATHYLISWEGYPDWENTKEPARRIYQDATATVQEYWAAQQQSNATPSVIRQAPRQQQDQRPPAPAAKVIKPAAQPSRQSPRLANRKT
jgi:hypothetical protein